MSISGWVPGDGTVGSEYAQPYGMRFSADNGTAPYIWKIAKGFIPPGMYLTTEGNDINGCRIIGTPLAGGTYDFTLAVTDGSSTTFSKDLTVTINGGGVAEDLSIEGELPDITLEVLLPQYWKYNIYTEGVKAIGGRSPYTWSVIAGSIPEGLELKNVSWSNDPSQIYLDGRPSGESTYAYNEFILQVVDADGRTAMKKFSISAEDGLPGGSSNVEVPYTIPVISGSLADGTEGDEYSGLLTVSEGTAPYTWTVDSDTLPAGMTLSCSDSTTGSGSGMTGKYAHLTGSPTAGGHTYLTTLKVQDANGATNAKSFMLKVMQASIPTSEPKQNNDSGEDTTNPESGDDSGEDTTNPDADKNGVPESDNSSSAGGGGGGGGCNSGLGLLGLAALGFLLTFTRKE